MQRPVSAAFHVRRLGLDSRQTVCGFSNDYSQSISVNKSHTPEPHLRLVEVDDDLQVGRPVVEPVGDGGARRRLQLRGEAGLQPLRARHHLDPLHPLFTEAKHLAAEILHLLVLYGIEFVEAWRRRGKGRSLQLCRKYKDAS